MLSCVSMTNTVVSIDSIGIDHRSIADCAQLCLAAPPTPNSCLGASLPHAVVSTPNSLQIMPHSLYIPFPRPIERAEPPLRLLRNVKPPFII